MKKIQTGEERKQRQKSDEACLLDYREKKEKNSSQIHVGERKKWWPSGHRKLKGDNKILNK